MDLDSERLQQSPRVDLRLMITLPPEPHPDDNVSANTIRQIIRALRALTPIEGKGIWFSRSPNGTVYNCQASSRDKTAAGTAALPWTFSCVEKEDEETGEKTREGGWTNCRLQIGYDTRWASPDLDHNSSYTIGGTSLTDDGYHYLEVTVGERDTAEIKVGRVVPATDPVAGKVRIFLAEINNAKVIGFQPHLNPVVYKYV